MLKSKDERMTTGYKLFLDDIRTVGMVVFVLLESEMVNRFKKILSQAKNEIEE